MCGIAAIAGRPGGGDAVVAMTETLRHRGPDGDGTYRDPLDRCRLGHRRLAILDLSPAGLQPMTGGEGRYHLSFNGEIYNYRELRTELGGRHRFRSECDTEVLLAAWERWGPACLDRLVGMFAFLLWDEREGRLWAVRDRFGVKPLYFHHAADGALFAASEIKALQAAGVGTEPDDVAWATYLVQGVHDVGARTFWKGVEALPAGHLATWADGRLDVRPWYDLRAQLGDADRRDERDVEDEVLALLTESVRLRFRSDVPVGVNLSGGLDSSVLLGLVDRVRGQDDATLAFTFVTGDERYDELPWVEAMVAHTRHPLVVCPLSAADVPNLAETVQAAQDEPFGGVPTLAYARLFERARDAGVVVLLDGQGLDEQWGGYDYYARSPTAGLSVQGSRQSPVRPECLTPELRRLAEPRTEIDASGDVLREQQLRDLLQVKLPRALRFNDRISMRVSRELREPFLDHRLVELALAQPAERKIRDGVHKHLLRKVAARLVPDEVHEAPKRPLQTPQREWLRGPLESWADDLLQTAIARHGGTWLDGRAVARVWDAYRRGESDNSYFVWQWIGLGLLAPRPAVTATATARIEASRR